MRADLAVLAPGDADAADMSAAPRPGRAAIGAQALVVRLGVERDDAAHGAAVISAGISVAWRADGEMHAIYIPLRHPDSDNFDPARRSIAGSRIWSHPACASSRMNGRL